MFKHLKHFILCIIVFYCLSNSNVLFCQDTVQVYNALTDTMTQQQKEIQLYFNHMNALMEYQEYKIEKYKSIIYLLIGLIAIIVTLLFLSWYSRKMGKSIQLVKVKKIDAVPSAVLKMIFDYWKVKENIKNIQAKLITVEGEVPNLADLINCAESYGFECFVLKSGMKEILELHEIPFIVLFPNHMAIVYNYRKEKVFMADAYYGYLDLKPYYFVNNWFADKSTEVGVFIALIPGQNQSKKSKKLREKLGNIDSLDKKQWKKHNLY